MIVSTFFFIVKLLFLFLDVVVRQIIGVICHVKFILNLISVLWSVFYLKAYIQHIRKLFRKKSYGLQATLLFLGNNRWHMPGCVKMISSWIRTVLVLLRHLCLQVLTEMLWHLQLWWLVFPWYPSCMQVIGLGLLLQLDTIFSAYITTTDGTGIQLSIMSSALLSNQLFVSTNSWHK